MATAKAIAPCIIWVDEAESLFAGHGGTSTDGGTTQRVQKQVLQDMQDSEEIFFQFTANDIDGFPDPLIDRMDVWMVDLPGPDEREEIWSIHIAKRGRKPNQFDLGELASVTDGFSGRQIEQLWLKAMTRSFNEDREPTTDDVLAEAQQFTTTSKLMATQIEQRRQRLAGRAKSASLPQAKSSATHGRKLTTK
jgi:SpoVK/Ycf46/Vps4 family AAA+-type ATPase